MAEDPANDRYLRDLARILEEMREDLATIKEQQTQQAIDIGILKGTAPSRLMQDQQLVDLAVVKTKLLLAGAVAGAILMAIGAWLARKF